MTFEPRDTVVDWTALSRKAAGSGYRPPRQPQVRSYLGLGASLIAVLLVMLGLGLTLRPSGAADASASPTIEPSTGPVLAFVEDKAFRFELFTPHAWFTSDQRIDPVARITYLGPAASVTISHAASPVLFTLREVGGTREMGGAMDQPCLRTTLRQGEPMEYAFTKSGTPNEGGFDGAWYQDPVLRLPAGRWRITAMFDVFVGECGGERHQLSVENTIDVGPAPVAATETTAAATPLPTPSPTLSADARDAREIVRKYVDALASGHSDVAWPMLSDWSKTTVGAFATFSDAERRLQAYAPAGPTIAVTDDPNAIQAALAEDRGVDLAAVADAGRAHLVTLDWPTSRDIAPKDLLVAPIDGRWSIWLDATAETYGAWPFPDGCPAFAMTVRRCTAVVDEAAMSANVDRSAAEAVWLLPEPGCGADPLGEGLAICTRTMSFVAGVRFDWAGQPSVRQSIFCGVGPPSLVCSETPGIQASDLHSGYWDVPCTGEPPAGCPSPIPKPPDPDHVGRPLLIDAVDVPVGAVGHHEEEIGRAVLVDGIVQEARFSIDQVQDTFLLDPGIVRLELHSTIAGRPPFDNIYQRGVFPGPEEVRVVLVYDVAETRPEAVLRIQDVEVR